MSDDMESAIDVGSFFLAVLAVAVVVSTIMINSVLYEATCDDESHNHTTEFMRP